MPPNADEARLMDRFVDRFVLADRGRVFSRESVRESLRIFLETDSVEGPVVSVWFVAIGAELAYMWDGTEADADAIIDAAALHLAERAKRDR